MSLGRVCCQKCRLTVTLICELTYFGFGACAACVKQIALSKEVCRRRRINWEGEGGRGLPCSFFCLENFVTGLSHFLGGYAINKAGEKNSNFSFSFQVF